MSQNFSFPPPPPPPPKPATIGQHNIYQQYDSRGGQRGRGSHSGRPQNDRGYGSRGGYQHQPRGSQRGSYAHRGNTMNFQANGHVQQHQRFTPSYQPNRDASKVQNQPFNSTQKRTHSTAFNDRPNTTQHGSVRSRPLAPPAVPSFGIDLENILSTKPTTSQNTKSEPPKKQNLLGLTPTPKNEDSESDDEGEEAKLANTITSNSLLQFEYKGQTSSLNTPAEIAAWIAERRRRWPTEARREVARKEAEEKKRKWEAERAARLEASRAAAKFRQEERQKQKLEREKSQVRQKLIREQIQKAKTKATLQESPGQTLNDAQLKAEKLRRKAEKIAAQLKKAEEALQKQDLQQRQPAAEVYATEQEDVDLDNLLAKVDQAAEAQASGIELDNSDAGSLNSELDSANALALAATAADDTSSSGSSGTDSDSGSDSSPEQLSTKRDGPERIHQPARKAIPDTRPLCINFVKSGRCKFGRRCHYRHEKPDKKAVQVKELGAGNRRKGLYQVMVEKEQEEERKNALRVIIALGDAGWLDSAAPPDAGAAVLTK